MKTGKNDRRARPARRPRYVAGARGDRRRRHIARRGFIYQWTRPFSDRVGPDDEVRIAVNNHYTAQNALNYQSFSAWTCAARRRRARSS